MGLKMPWLLACLAVVGCGNVRAPAAARCGSTRGGGSTAAQLTEGLANAKPGECVVAQGTSYQGNFTVPAGVKLVAQEGLAVTIGSDDATRPAITVNGGAGAGLFGITVENAAGTGIEVLGGPAQITKVSVRKAGQIALRITCAGADCMSEGSLIEIIDTELRESQLGLAIFGARVKVIGGASSAHTSTRLGYGYGVVTGAGSSVVLEGTQVEGNLSAGIVVDGTGGSSLQLTDVKVINNLGRGVWAQGLTGTDALPKLVVSGAQTKIDGNRVVGLGAAGSTGILISDASISNTVKVKLSSAAGLFEDVGDGVGLFSGSGQARLERVVLENNQRGQMVIDKGARGIIIPDFGKVAGGEYKLVIQNTTETVDAPAASISMPGRELLVRAESLSIVMP